MQRSLTIAMLLLAVASLLMAATHSATKSIQARSEFRRLADKHAEISNNFKAALERLQQQEAGPLADSARRFHEMDLFNDVGNDVISSFDYYDSRERAFNSRRELCASFEPRLSDLERRMATAARIAGLNVRTGK